MGETLDSIDEEALFKLMVKINKQKIPPCQPKPLFGSNMLTSEVFCGTCCIDCEKLYYCYNAWLQGEKLMCIQDPEKRGKWCSATKEFLDKLFEKRGGLGYPQYSKR